MPIQDEAAISVIVRNYNHGRYLRAVHGVLTDLTLRRLRPA